MSGATEDGRVVTAQLFVQKASQDGMTEVKLADLALQKSKSDDVRKFANQMQKDHGNANSELESIAASKHLTVANTLDAEHQAMITEMNGKTGIAFDAAYATHMVSAHQKAVALFKAGEKSQDKDISGFAAKTLPTLEGHQGMADGLESKTKVAAAATAGPANR